MNDRAELAKLARQIVDDVRDGWTMEAPIQALCRDYLELAAMRDRLELGLVRLQQAQEGLRSDMLAAKLALDALVK